MNVIEPGKTIGMLGGGQLGRMFAQAAQRMGYHVCVFAPELESPAAQVSAQNIQANYDDEAALDRFAQHVDVATIEFENIPAATLARLADQIPAYPSARILSLKQSRIKEKCFLADHGFPVSSFRPIQSRADALNANTSTRRRVLKTASGGYDGKGQSLVEPEASVTEAWNLLGEVDCILEAFVEFSNEFSVIVARTEQETRCYDPILNDHENHILSVSSSPTNLPALVCQQAMEIASDLAGELGLIGVMCIEFFLSRDGEVLINEYAPRPHNSGHLTIEAHATSQFEQHVRSVCGLPLGSTQQARPAAMANLLGDLWGDDEPDWSRVLAEDHISLHLYGKQQARVGRKMGHLTATSDSVRTAIERVKELRSQVARGGVKGTVS